MSAHSNNYQSSQPGLLWAQYGRKEKSPSADSILSMFNLIIGTVVRRDRISGGTL